MNMPPIFHNRAVGSLIAILFLQEYNVLVLTLPGPSYIQQPLVFSLSHVRLFSKVMTLHYIPTSHIMGPFSYAQTFATIRHYYYHSS